MVMATSANSDLVPVRKATKTRLESLKGARSYDEVIRDLLDSAPTAGPAEKATASATRDPDEQLLIARLAQQRWMLWRADGKIRDVGPRLVEYRIDEPTREVRIDRPQRRGFAP